jgi:hypothetical protein
MYSDADCVRMGAGSKYYGYFSKWRRNLVGVLNARYILDGE